MSISQKIKELNDKRIAKVLRRNGVAHNNVPPLTGTYEERSHQRTAEINANNQKRINKVMRKYR